MAEGKKSFILYCDIKHTVDHLTDQQAGKLFKHIIAYVNDMDPQTKDIRVKLAFEPIKHQLKRDLKKWEDERTGRSEAGKKGMASRWNNKPLQKITNDNSVIPAITKITVTDNVTVNVNDTVNEGRNTAPEKFSIEDCLLISLRDSRWVKANSVKKEEVSNYNYYLEKQGKYEMNPLDYKKYFCTLKDKYPHLIKKTYTIEEYRAMAIELDKTSNNGKSGI